MKAEITAEDTPPPLLGLGLTLYSYADIWKEKTLQNTSIKHHMTKRLPRGL